MKIVIAGARWLGAAVLDDLVGQPGIEVVAAIAPSHDDRLAQAAAARAVPATALNGARAIAEGLIPDGCDLIVAAHCHAFISPCALSRASRGGIGYHPSLLPRHRGRNAVEATVKAGDPIAGGTVYRLTSRFDAGPVLLQDWCFVGRGESASELWRRALGPMGLDLLGRAVSMLSVYPEIDETEQDEAYANVAI
jgi:methionyl-tRNA formyltransferase